MSGLAMLKYVPRLFRVKQVDGNAFFTEGKRVDWYPEQPVGLRLPKGFKIPRGATFDFDFEKEQLLKILDAAWHARSTADWQPHPMFGPVTVKEWGKLLQIHIDYHLRQFAA
jgi:hypothetical protein